MRLRDHVVLTAAASLVLLLAVGSNLGLSARPGVDAESTTIQAGSGQTLALSAYAAVGDGRTDDSVALTKAFTQAPAGSTITVPLGKTYAHSTTLRVTVAGSHITGGGTLLATNIAATTLDIQANNVTVDGGMTSRFDTTGATRQYTGAQSMILLNKSSGAVIENVKVDGSPAGGVLAVGASYYKIDHVTVRSTLADCFHSTYGSHDGLISNSASINSGDDGFANVSYLGDGNRVYNMTYLNDRVEAQLWGRGFTVVSGHDISFTNIYSDGTPCVRRSTLLRNTNMRPTE